MAEGNSEQPPLEPDLIITKEGEVSRIEEGKVMKPYERGRVSDVTDEEGGLHVNASTGRVFYSGGRERPQPQVKTSDESPSVASRPPKIIREIRRP